MPHQITETSIIPRSIAPQGIHPFILPIQFQQRNLLARRVRRGHPVQLKGERASETRGMSPIAITNLSDGSSANYRNAGGPPFGLVLISHHFQMTPLPRWVLLASVLAVVGAQPVDNACVHACRARERSPEITGVICDHRRSAVLQSAGGRSPIQRLSSICLTPCGGPTSQYDGSEVCRDFRELLIKSQACPGNDRQDDNSRNIRIEHSSSKNFDRVDHHELRSSKSAMLKKLAIADHYLVLEPLENEDSYRFRVKMRPEEQAKFEDRGLSELNPQGPTLTELEESSVDWDTWCMAQCNKGHGGSACDCDLIP